MRRVASVFLVAIATLFGLSMFSIAQDKPKAYPIALKADDVREIPELSIELNGLTVTGKNLLVVPIRCELGITGAVLLGTGDFSFAPEDGDKIKGVFRAAMLRFDPADQPLLLPLDKTNPMTDLAAQEMSQHLLNNIFRHCWHSGKDALIPDTGSFVANVYSKTDGDLLISTGPKASVVHNFTAGKTIYPKK
jgi:hypothetical protein